MEKNRDIVELISLKRKPTRLHEYTTQGSVIKERLIVFREEYKGKQSILEDTRLMKRLKEELKNWRCVIGMPTLHNEEIMAMRNTVSLLRKRIALEPNQSKKAEMKKNVKELESMIVKKLDETSDFHDIRLEEDIY